MVGRQLTVIKYTATGGMMGLGGTMNCVNCGHENPAKALICYWCGVDPATGEQPYKALAAPASDLAAALSVPEVHIPEAITVPSPMPVPSLGIGLDALEWSGMAMPELPQIEIAPPPQIPDEARFTTRRRRACHRPVVRLAPSRPMVTRPVLSRPGRILVLFGGLGISLALGLALVAAVGAASLGSAFCFLGLLVVAVLLWGGLLLARTGKRVVERAGVVYERLEVLGRALREVAPGAVQELPVNLPKRMGVLELPVAYSELRSLAGQEGESPSGLAEDLLVGAIANLVGRDDVILARRTYPVATRGMLVRPTNVKVIRPVLLRRRAYVGPGELEARIAKKLRTDQPLTIEELMRALVRPEGRASAQQVVDRVSQALSENPPDLEALASPDDALAELDRFRDAIRQADPELYHLLEDEVRRGLGAVVQRTVPASLLDMARYASTPGQSRPTSGTQRRG